MEYDVCHHCHTGFEWVRSRAGQERLYCGSACSQAAYRKRQAEAKEERERWERWEREERERQERARQREQGRSTGADGGSGAYRRGGLGVTEARAILFRLAGLPDDGRTDLRSVYLGAMKRLHPDVNPDGTEDTKLLARAAESLRAAGHRV